MSLRHGVTAPEENLMKRLILEGKAWKDIAPHLQDVDLPIVKRNIYDLMAVFLPYEKAVKAAVSEGKVWADIEKTVKDADRILVKKHVYDPAKKLHEYKKSQQPA